MSAGRTPNEVQHRDKWHKARIESANRAVPEVINCSSLPPVDVAPSRLEVHAISAIDSPIFVHPGPENPAALRIHRAAYAFALRSSDPRAMRSRRRHASAKMALPDYERSLLRGLSKHSLDIFGENVELEIH